MRNLKLISVHVPKCAGTSFYEVLKARWGADKVARSLDEVTEETVAVHGHFSAMKALVQLRSLRAEDCKLITWLRHPVSRLMSHWSFYDRGEGNGAEAEQFWAERPTLAQFATWPGQQRCLRTFADLYRWRWDFVGAVGLPWAFEDEWKERIGWPLGLPPMAEWPRENVAPVDQKRVITFPELERLLRAEIDHYRALVQPELAGSWHWRQMAATATEDEIKEQILTGWQEKGFVEPHNQAVAVLADRLRERLAVLDFGCGLGRNIAAMQEAGAMWDITGYDVPEMMRRHGSTPVRWEKLRRTRRFDAIHAALVLQHLHPVALDTVVRDWARMTDVVIVAGRFWSDHGRHEVAQLVSRALGAEFVMRVHREATEASGWHGVWVWER